MRPSLVRLQLFVHSPSQDIITFNNVDPQTTIYDLKSMIEIKSGIIAELQNLYVSNVKIDDQKTLRETQIKTGTFVRVKVKEKSLEEIYRKAMDGDIKIVFRLGVEFVDFENMNEIIGYELDHMNVWNSFVPLRAFQAMFAASCGGHVKLLMELVIKSAANVTMVTRHGRSLLHVAASQGHLMCVNILLGQGVDPKLEDKDGMTALSLAAKNGHVKVEKRIWVFSWNMDALDEMENMEKEDESAEQRDIVDVQMTAKKYHEDFKRGIINKSVTKLPTIDMNCRTDWRYKGDLNCKKYEVKGTILPKIISGPEEKYHPKVQEMLSLRKALTTNKVTRDMVTNATLTKNPVQKIDLNLMLDDKVKLLDRKKQKRSRVSAWVQSTVVRYPDPNETLESAKHETLHVKNEKKERNEVLTDSSSDEDLDGAKCSQVVETKEKGGSENRSTSDTKVRGKESNREKKKTLLSLKIVEAADIQYCQTKKKELIKTSVDSIASLNQKDSKEIRGDSTKRIHVRNKTVRSAQQPSEEAINGHHERNLAIESSTRHITCTENKPREKSLVNLKDIYSFDGKETNAVIHTAVISDIKSILDTVKVFNENIECKEPCTNNDGRSSNIDRKASENMSNKGEPDVDINTDEAATSSLEENVTLLNFNENECKGKENTIENQKNCEAKKNVTESIIYASKQCSEGDIIHSIKIDRNLADQDKVEDGNKSVNEEVNEELWKPAMSFASESFIGFCDKHRKTFDKWLEEKKQVKKGGQKNLPPSTIVHSATKRHEMNENHKNEKNEEAFQKWLLSKTKQSARSKSSPGKQRNDFERGMKGGIGITFEQWAEMKRDHKIKPTSPFTRKRHRNIRQGMTFEEWKDKKIEQCKNMKSRISNKNSSGGDKSVCRISFEKWLELKKEERRIQMSIKVAMKAREEKRERFLYNSRMNDPRQKTFEEWYLEKRYDWLLHKKKKNNSAAVEKCKPEDSNLIFDMWLGDKFFREMKQEKEELKRMKQSGRQKFSNRNVRLKQSYSLEERSDNSFDDSYEDFSSENE